MSQHLQRIISDERGLTTAEYAIGTVAVAGLGGVLLKLLTSDLVRDLIWNVIKSALSTFFG
jgi:Flp pilus assembly pilin Flp